MNALIEMRCSLYPQVADVIQKAIEHLDVLATHYFDSQMIAAAAGMSSSDIDALFMSWADVSASQFFRVLYAPNLTRYIGDALLEAHCLSVELIELATQQATGNIVYGWYPTPFGLCWLAVYGDAITDLHFVDEHDDADVRRFLTKRWPKAKLVQDNAAHNQCVESIFLPKKSGTAHPPKQKALVSGTDFQYQVWRRLTYLQIGQLTTYQDIGQAIGAEGASQAIGNAVGANPIGYLLPCHRVVRKTGVVSEYRWGSTRKLAMLGYELAGRIDQLQKDKMPSLFD